MPQIRYMIPKHQSKALWAAKDELQVLSKDPMKLHKTAFVEYLRAKGEQLYAEATTDAAQQEADAYLHTLTINWKEAAKAHALSRTA